MYVKRDQQGNLIAVSKEAAPGFVEAEGDASREITEFFAESGQRQILQPVILISSEYWMICCKY